MHDRMKEVEKLLEELRKAALSVDQKMASDLTHANERITQLVRYKTKGFMDGTVEILGRYGMSPDTAYSAADEIWETVKREVAESK